MLCAIDDTLPNRPHEGALALEATGGPTVVEFKDIRLRRIANTSVPPSAPQWITLFDGSSLGAWQGWNGADWRGAWEILNGELRTLRGGNVNLATREDFGDFELEFEWKVAPGANSGVFYHVPASAIDLPKAAPELQIVDDATPDGAKPITAAGSIYGVVAALNKRLMPVGAFNTTRVVARGSHVEHWLNGEKILEYDRGTPEFRKLVEQSKYKNIPNFGEWADGHILLQEHGSIAYFRNVKIRVLDK
jgi:hypothetical protein